MNSRAFIQALHYQQFVADYSVAYARLNRPGAPGGRR